MQTALQILASVAIVAVVPVLWSSRNRLRHTSLTAAWGWAVAGLLLWAAAWGTMLAGTVDAGLADQLWYAAAVVLLCPPIAVLGARRPGSGAWTWFVLLPLLLVFGLPALAAWSRQPGTASVELETPMLLGFLLVLIMGTGNYFGTRHTLSALVFAAGLVLAVAPLSIALRDAFPGPTVSRACGTLGLSLAILLAARRSGRAGDDRSALDRLWIDFRDTFGLVWARRVQDRINRAADEESWPARLEMHGLVWTRPELAPETRTRTAARVEQTFRWILKRFVDPEWIDARLRTTSVPRCPEDSQHR